MVKSDEKSLQKSRRGIGYSLAVRTAALRDLFGGMSRKAVAEKYSINDASVISHWKRKFASMEEKDTVLNPSERLSGKVSLSSCMDEQSRRISDLERSLSECRRELRKRENELRTARLKAMASEKMVELAEKELGVDIRKKAGSK